MANFTFDSKLHQYKIDGIVFPSVSQVLPYNYTGDNTFAMLRGTHVHTMCKLYLENNLNENALDPILIPYLDAFKKFLYETKSMGIQGIIDIKSGVPHPCVELQIPAYIELVNHGVPMSAPESMPVLEMPFYHPVYQYCGTPDIVIFENLPVAEGHALYLKKNGKYSLKTIDDISTNLETFLSFLRTEKWKKEKGIKQWK